MVTFLFLRETTVLPLIWAVLRGRRVSILGCYPIFRPLRRLLEWVEIRVRSRGGLTDPCEVLPGIKTYRETPALAERLDIHAATEDWMRRRYAFEEISALGMYGEAYRHLTANHFFGYHVDLVVLETVTRIFAVTGPKCEGKPHARLLGVPSDMADLYAAYFGQRLPGARRLQVLSALLLVPSLISALCRSLIWIARRVRLRTKPPQQFFLAADAYGDRRDLRVFREALDSGTPVLFVAGDYGGLAQLSEMYAPDLTVVDVHGRFDPLSAVRTAAGVTGDMIRLAVFSRRLSPGHAFRLLNLAHERAVTSGLLNRWRPSHWWRRDYTRSEHVIRTHLLRRAGVKSICYPHAIPTGTVLHPFWRFMDYDLVYSCPALHSIYRDTWPSHMEVRYAGSASFDAAAAATCAARPKAGDFAIFIALTAREPEMLRTVDLLARTFPERTIHIKLKRSIGLSDTEFGAYFLHPNIVVAEDEASELLKNCRYVVSDISTIIQEAVQFGCVTFLLDVLPGQQSGFLREFPELCVTAADELLSRIQAVEDGSRPYARDTLAGLTDLGGTPFSQALRSDLGLAPRA